MSDESFPMPEAKSSTEVFLLISSAMTVTAKRQRSQLKPILEWWQSNHAYVKEKEWFVWRRENQARFWCPWSGNGLPGRAWFGDGTRQFSCSMVSSAFVVVAARNLLFRIPPDLSKPPARYAASSTLA